MFAIKFICLFFILANLISCVARPDAAESEAFDLDVLKQYSNQAPKVGNDGLVRITAMGAQFVSLSFSLASDDSTLASLLEYKLIALDSSGKSVRPIFGWQKLSKGEYQIELNSFEALFFKLSVRDSQLKESSYHVFTHAPILPDNVAINLQTPSADTIKLSWQAATHLYIDNQALQYKLVRAESLIDLPNGIVEIDWTNDLLDLTLARPASGKTYFYQLSVRTPFAVEINYPSVEFSF